MAEIPTNIFTSGGNDNAALMTMLASRNNDGMSNSPLTLIALLAMMRNMGLDGNQNADRAAIDAAVSAALAQNNQANNNAMLLLKDIQDSSQDVIAAVNAGTTSTNNAIMQAEIANLQGQGNITTAIADSKYTAVNEIHEAASSIMAAGTANTAQLAATLNTLAMSLQAGHAEINANIAQAKYDNTIATMQEGEKTRTALAAVAAQLPTQAYLDLERQLLAEQSNHRHTQTRQIVDSGNTTVTNNISTAVTQNQNQNLLLSRLEAIAADLQRNTNSTIAIGSILGNAAQTATNVRQ